MKIALVQTDIAWEDPGASLKRLNARIAEAAERGAELVVLPEMSTTGVTLRPEKIAEPADGPVYRQFRALAQKYGTAIAFGLATTRGARFFNTLCVIGRSGEALYTYDKIHPFSFGGEDRLYAPGETVGTFQIGGGGPRIGGVICYDLRFPELFTTLAPECDLFLVPANWPAARGEHWDLLLRARALDSLAYVAGVNRVGTGGKLEFAGGSALIGPWGEVLARAGAAEETLVVDVDCEQVRTVRGNFSLLDDRRPFRAQTAKR